MIVGVVSGAIAVLLFHQPVVEIFRLLGLTTVPVYSTAPTLPWGVPQLWSLVFWGGVWGALLAAALARREGARLVLAAILFGAIAPTLVAWFVVAPLKSQLVAAGLVPVAMLLGLLANAAWGFGTGVGLALFGRHGKAHD